MFITYTISVRHAVYRKWLYDAVTCSTYVCDIGYSPSLPKSVRYCWSLLNLPVLYIDACEIVDDTVVIYAASVGVTGEDTAVALAALLGLDTILEYLDEDSVEGYVRYAGYPGLEDLINNHLLFGSNL